MLNEVVQMMDNKPNKQLFVLLEEIRIWSKFGGFIELSKLVKETLSTKTERMVYEASDGSRSSREIASKLDITHGTVVNMWRRWHSLGLVEESSEFKGRFKHIMSLKRLGIRIVKRKAEIRKKSNEPK